MAGSSFRMRASRKDDPAIAALLRSAESDYGILWLEPAAVLAFLPHGTVDIAVMDRTGKVLQMHSGVGHHGYSVVSVGWRALTKAPMAIVARDGLLRDAVSEGMVLFWQDRPMLPLDSRLGEEVSAINKRENVVPAYMPEASPGNQRLL
ncbi:MAG: hypothetical protein ACYDD9_02150 [Acidithiobacillus sp.]